MKKSSFHLVCRVLGRVVERNRWLGSALLGAVLAAPSVHAVDLNWRTNAGGVWSDAANWGGTNVVSGDRLKFNNTLVTMNGSTNTNDIAGVFVGNGSATTPQVDISGLTNVTFSGTNMVLNGLLQLGSTSTNIVWNIPLIAQTNAIIQVSGGSRGTFGGTLDLNGFGATLQGGAGASQVYQAIISGTGNLVKTQANTWILTANNTYTGVTVITSSGGTLAIGNGTGSGRLGTGRVTNSGTLNFNRNDAVTVTNQIDGSGGVSFGSAQTVTLLGSNSFTGPVTLSGAGGGGAVVRISNVTALARAGTNSIGVGIGNTDAARLELALTGANTYDRSFSTDSRNTPFNPHIRNVSGTNTLTGNLTVGSGGGFSSYQVDSGSLALNFAALSGNRGFALVGSGNGSVSALAGNQGIYKSGSGTWTILVNQTYTGAGGLSNGTMVVGTTIAGGVLQLGNGGTAGAVGSGAVTNGGILLFNRSDAYAFAPAIFYGTGSVIQAGSGSVTLSGTNTYTGQTLLSNGTLVVNSSLSASPVFLAGGALGGTGQVASATVQQAGPGLAPGPAALAGSIGTLTVATNLVFGHTSGTATNQFDLTGVTTEGAGVNDLISVTGDVVWTNNVAFDISGPVVSGAYTLISYTGTPLASTNGLEIGGAAAQSRNTFSFDVATAGKLLLNVTATAASNLVWAGSATNSTWVTGDVGALNWDANNGKFYNFDTITFDDTAAAFAVDVVGTVTPAALSVNATSNYVFAGSGSIAGTNGIAKSGAGTLYVGTSNTFTGPVTISGGTLVVSNAAALGSTAGGTAVSGGGTLDVNGINIGQEPLTLAGAGVGGNGALVNNGASQTSVSGFTLNADATIGGATRLDVNSGTVSAATNVVLNGFVLTKAGTNEVSFANSRLSSGTVSVAQGRLTLSGTNTFSRLGAAFNVGAADFGLFGGVPVSNLLSTVTLSNSLFYDFGGGANTYSGPVIASAATTNGIVVTSSLTIGGNVSGSGDVVKTGAGTLTLAASNDFSGNLIITTGTVAVSTLGGLTQPASVTVSNGQRLQLNAAGVYAGSTSTGTTYLAGFYRPDPGVFGASSSAALYYNNNGAGTYQAPIVLTTNAGILAFGVSVNLTLNGGISGTGDLSISGRGGSPVSHTATFTLNAPATHSGATWVFNHDGVTNVFLKAGLANVLPTNQLLGLGFDGTQGYGVYFDLNGFDQQVGGLAYVANNAIPATKQAFVYNTGTGMPTFTVANVTNLSWPGVIGARAGSASGFGLNLQKSGAGQLTLTAAQTYTGVTTVAAGTLNVNGSIASPAALSVSAGATLAGTGIITSPVTVLADGNITGGTNGGVGVLRVTNAVILGAGATNVWDYTGASSDRLSVNSIEFLGAWTLSANAVGITNGTYTLVSTVNGVTNFVAPTITGVVGGTVSVAGNDVVLTVATGGGLTPFETWQTNYFGTVTNVNAAYDADPDNDGANNLLEYAFGSNPTLGSSVTQPQVGTDGNFLTITVPRNSNATDISYLVQGGTNLLSWATLTTLTATNPAPAGSTVTYTNSTGLDAFPAQFLRVKITQP